MTLKELHIGGHARIESISGEKGLRQHLLDMGMIPGAELTLMKLAPMGDPMEICIHGYELTLRVADAEKVEIIELSETVSPKSEEESGNVEYRNVKGSQPENHSNGTSKSEHKNSGSQQESPNNVY